MQHSDGYGTHGCMLLLFERISYYRRGTDICNGKGSQDHEVARVIQEDQQSQEELISTGILVKQMLNYSPQRGKLTLSLRVFQSFLSCSWFLDKCVSCSWFLDKCVSGNG